MRILMVIERHQSGGAQMAFWQQTLLLKHFGHHVAHFTLSDLASSPHCPADVHFKAFVDINRWLKKKQALQQHIIRQRGINRIARFGYLTLTTGVMKQRFKSALQQYQPDVVHFHSVLEFLTPGFIEQPKAMGVASVLTVHDAWPICPSRQLIKPSLMVCDGECAQEVVPGQACQQYRCVTDPIERYFNVLAFRQRYERDTLNWVDRILSPSNALTTLLQQSAIAPDADKATFLNPTQQTLLDMPLQAYAEMEKTFFLFSGRLQSYKGVWTLLKAFSNKPHIPLYIAGDGPERDAMQRWLEQNQIHHITLLGWQSAEALSTLYRTAYAIIVPSEWFENAPLVVQEAYAYGKPVIASRIGGLPEMVQHQQTGLLFSPSDVQSLQDAVQSLWGHPQQAAQMGQAGYRWFQSQYNWQNSYQQLMQHYEQAIQAAQVSTTELTAR